MRLEEIEKRLAELKGLVEAEKDSAKLDEYEKEIRSLIQEKGEILGEQRAAKRAEARAAFEKGIVVEEKPADMDETMKRAKELISGHTCSIEARSVLVSSTNLATPTSVSNKINDKMNKVPGLLEAIHVEDHTGEGEHKVPFVSTESAAVAGTEGSAPENTGAAFSYVVIKPFFIDCVDYTSKLIPGQSPVPYYEKVQQLAIKAVRRKAVDLVVNGATSSGSLVAYGLTNGVDKAGNAMYQAVTLSAAIGAGTLRSIVLNYGSDDTIDGPATLLLRKETLQLFGAVRGTNEKKAVYDIEFKEGSVTEGIIRDGGLAVMFMICNNLPAGKMAYGILENFELDLFSPIKVEVDGSYKFAEGLDTIKATALIGGNIIVPGGIAVITQHSTGAGTTESPTVYD